MRAYHLTHKTYEEIKFACYLSLSLFTKLFEKLNVQLVEVSRIHAHQHAHMSVQKC